MKLTHTLLIIWALILMGLAGGQPDLARAGSFPLTLSDSRGDELVLKAQPRRIVSLSPAATEVLDALGAGDELVGTTYHDTRLSVAQNAAVVGGISNPSPGRIAALRPDLLIATGFHEELIHQYRSQGVPVFVYRTDSIAQGFENIRLIGNLVGREGAALALIRENQDQLAHIQAKIKKMNLAAPRRVIRLMGRSSIMTPGNDSFMNDLIRAAGGVPPDFGRAGDIITVEQAEWESFNPQVIYGCPPDKDAAAILDQPGWKDVDAVENGNIHYFPCDMTCRASVQTGAFVAWLSSIIYPREFADSASWVRPSRVYKSRILDVDMDILESARILYSYTDDFKNKTLVLKFKTPRNIVSTLDGYREGISTVGNHYFPPPTWIPGPYAGMDHMKESIYSILGKGGDQSSFLITGADMDHVSIVTQKFREMKVTALVTAGVMSNAMRMGRDTGAHYEPGTINVILLSNVKMSQRAMTRAIISATEGKTAAMEDLDIRSTYTPAKNAATGTGTDNVLVVQGDGPTVENSGGHSKLGELIARAVYQGVVKAVAKQNKVRGNRDIFQRLDERGIHVFALASGADCGCRDKKSDFAAMVEYLLLQPEYAGFMSSALALSDAWQRGLVQDLTAFDQWCLTLAGEIGGETPAAIEELVVDENIPRVLRKALNTIMTGARLRVAAMGGGSE
ncbi:MAG: helical backbone metal receptor [Desulfobacterales bacterium]|nr:helical backbone metal receptor [Desulfobacterales bacterium]